MKPQFLLLRLLLLLLLFYIVLLPPLDDNVNTVHLKKKKCQSEFINISEKLNHTCEHVGRQVGQSLTIVSQVGQSLTLVSQGVSLTLVSQVGQSLKLVSMLGAKWVSPLKL